MQAAPFGCVKVATLTKNYVTGNCSANPTFT